MHELQNVPEILMNMSDISFSSKLEKTFLGEDSISHGNSQNPFENIGDSDRIIQEVREQANTFREYLQKHERLIIAHHTDADGLMSVITLLHLLSQMLNCSLQELFYEKIVLLSVNNGLRNFDDEQMSIVRNCVKLGYTGVLFADLSPRDSKQLAELQTMGFEIGNVDHHILEKDPPPIDVRYNPSTIQGIPEKFVNQLSTSALILPVLPHSEKIRWIATLGNLGDESFTLAADLPPELKGQYYQLARDINQIGTTEQYDVTAMKRDAFVRKILTAFLFQADAATATGFTTAKEIVDTTPAFKERKESISTVMEQTQLFLLEAVKLAIGTTSEDKNQESTLLQLVMVTSDEGHKALIFEGETYRLILHDINTKEVASGNLVVGPLIKSHLNALSWQKQNETDGTEKPTTVLLSQTKDKELTELGLYTTDGRVYQDSEHACHVLMQWLRKKYGIGGGGHPDRAGGDIYNQDFGKALWELFTKLATFLAKEGDESLPQDILNTNGEELLFSIFRPDQTP